MMNKSLRVAISIIVIALPIALLFMGIYGTFLFTFSIPILWQIGLLGESINSLGLRRENFKSSLIAGLVTGVLLSFLGGILLKTFGIRGYSLSDVGQFNFSRGLFKISFILKRELGYKLMGTSNDIWGLFLYLFFCMFLVGLGEELFWRGFIQKKIGRRWPKAPDVAIAAILFSLVHIYIFEILSLELGTFFLVLIAMAALCWGYLYKRYNNIWGPALSHGIVAFVIWKYFFFLGNN